MKEKGQDLNMAEGNKRKRDGVSCYSGENSRQSKHPKCDPTGLHSEGEHSHGQVAPIVDNEEVSGRELTNIKQNQQEAIDESSPSLEEQTPRQEAVHELDEATSWDTTQVPTEQKDCHASKGKDPIDGQFEEASSSGSRSLERQDSGSNKGLSEKGHAIHKSSDAAIGGSEISVVAGSSLVSLDTVDMEAAQALTFLKQSASPSKSSATSSAGQREEKPNLPSNTTLYTGSIRRKGFAKSSLARQHLQKSVLKKLTPARCGGDTDSDSQHDSPDTVSPQRMVIDLQPTRKSARQAARETQEKPWSTMIKRGKRTQLEKKFERRRGDETEGRKEDVEGKKTRGRKKRIKSPSLDEHEMALAKQACDILEKRLEENAAKNNLSVVNVKNILHHVITNEHVLAMVHNTMGDESVSDQLKAGIPSGSKSAVFEPKMTRAKLKEVSKKSGKVPFVWPVSPVKKPKPQFTDLDFSYSDDDDDDYKPSQEELLKDESDYESMTSFGSPCPSTPRSSLNTSLLEDLDEEGQDEEDDEAEDTAEGDQEPPGDPPCTPPPPVTVSSPGKASHLRAVAVPMGPPPPRFRPEKVKDDAAFLKQLEEVNLELEKSEDTIAHRTRSKFPIDTSLEEIEASFIAPDITEDMFEKWDDCGEDNEEWVRWLAGLYHGPKDPESNDVGEDDQNDPEYNFLAEEEALDEEDFRNDKTVQISQKEVNELLDELINAYENEDWAADFDMQHFDRTPQPTLSNMIAAQRQTLAPLEAIKPKKAVPLQQQQQQQQGMVFNAKEMSQLQQQMQQHVQLLAQIHVLSRGNKLLEPHMNQAQLFLNELDMLAGRSESTYSQALPIVGTQQPFYTCSAFRACNLAGALQITTQEFAVTEIEIVSMKANDAWRTSTNDNAKRRNQIHRSPPPEGAQDIIAHNKVFMYSELLPIYSLTDKPLDKIVFEKSEDNLIALGLMQFPVTSDRQVQYRMITQNMLPIKTTRQVMVHVKNVCSKPKSQNVIKNWRKHGVKPTLAAPCIPVLPGSEKAPENQYQLYDKNPEWLKKYQSSFHPQRPRITPSPVEGGRKTPALQPELHRKPDSGKTTPVPTPQRTPTPLPTPLSKGFSVNKFHKIQARSFSQLEPLLPSLGLEGHLRVHTLFPKIAPKPADSTNMPIEVPQKSVLVINPQQGIINAIGGSTVQIIQRAGGELALSTHKDPAVLINPTAATSSNPMAATSANPTAATSANPTAATSANPTAATNVNPTAATNVNPTAATNVNPTAATNVNPVATTSDKSPDSHQVALISTPNSSPRTSPSISPSGISALQNFKVQQLGKAKSVCDLGQADKPQRIDTRSLAGKTKQAASKTSTSNEMSKQSTQIKKTMPLNEKQVSSSKTSNVSDTTKPDSENQNLAASTKNPVPVSNPSSSTTQSPTVSNKSPIDDKVALEKGISLVLKEEEAYIKEANRPPSRSKSNTPDSLLEEEHLEDDNLEEAVASPGENILENADSNCQESLDVDSLPDPHPSGGSGMTEGPVEERDKASTLTTKMAAKRMKTKLRRDLESTVVLLDSDIVSKDPKREERETSFSRAYLNKVKERFSSDPERYIDFLGIFNSFSQTPEVSVDKVYLKISEALEGHPDLVEDFVAFLPSDVAVGCGVLMENLEFAKARLFLRQVEVHFQKNPSQFQKVLATILEWGSKDSRTNNELKDNLLPLLKGQPHLEQEFSLLFPDERPPDNYMMDFEEIIWDDDKDKEYDSFEEIEIPDSDEEVPITKSRVGRPPNKPPSSTQVPPGPRVHSLIPKAALLKGRLPSILKSPVGKKSKFKCQAIDPWQELNTHLQYGTQGCKCNCHEKSHDSRVQRKVRHCAYCSAMVTRTELISSLRGFTMGNRRRPHLLTTSQQPGTSDGGAPPSVAPKRGSGRNLSGRKSQKVHWASTEEADQDLEEEEEEDEEEEENLYSDAVAHLSEICSNLADYLNENASEEEEEEEKETDIDDDDETNDVADDDAEDGQDEDDYEDLEEDEDDPDEKPEEDEDEADDAIITSEESHGLDGTTPDSTASPIIQDGQESCPSGGSSEGKPDLKLMQTGSTSNTTLLGSGVILEGSGSRANSPVTYSEDDQSTEDHMRLLKECLSQDRREPDSGSNPPSVKSLICEEGLPDSPVKQSSAILKPTTLALPKDESEKNKVHETEESSLDSVTSVTATQQGSLPSPDGTGQRSSPRQLSERTIRRVTTVRPTHIPTVPFGQSERMPLFESLAKCQLSAKEVKSPEKASSSGLAQRTSGEQAQSVDKVQCLKQSSDLETESPKMSGSTPEKNTSGMTEASQPSPQDVKAESAGSPAAERPSLDTSRGEPEKVGGPSLLSAANVATRQDGEVVVVWTRDADRLLLQQCQDQGASPDIFEQVARTLGDKTSQQVAERFTTLMKLFQSATQDRVGEDEEDDDEEEGSSDDGDDAKEESDVDN